MTLGLEILHSVRDQRDSCIVVNGNFVNAGVTLVSSISSHLKVYWALRLCANKLVCCCNKSVSEVYCVVGVPFDDVDSKGMRQIVVISLLLLFIAV